VSKIATQVYDYGSNENHEASNLPEGWLEASIDTVVDLNPPKPPKDFIPTDAPVTFVPMPAVDAYSGTIIAPECRPFGAVRKGYTSFHENDVIFAKITPCMENGKAAIARNLINGLGFGSTEFHVFRSTGPVIPEYLYYYIRQESFRRSAEAEMTGSVGQRRVPAKFVRNSLLPLPPLAEQKRIVAKVDELLTRVNAAREHLAKVQEILKRFRQSVLAAACSGRLTSDWRNLNTINAMQTMCQTEYTNFRSLPENWKVVPVQEIATVRGGKRLPKGHQYSETKTSFPYLRVTDFKEMSVGTNDLKFITAITLSKIRRYTISQSDVFISIAGSIGMVGLIPEQLDGASLTENAAKLTELKDITKEFLCYALNSQFSQNQITRLMTSSGQPKLALFRIKTILVPLPPIDEQLEITNRVRTLFQIAKAIEKRVTTATVRTESLTQATLAKAFRGELVPTEAELARRESRSYESAFALLAKTKAQRKDVKFQRKLKSAKESD